MGCKMFKLHRFTVFAICMVRFVFEIPLFCDSCQNSFVSFEEILQRRQQTGKFPRDAALTLLRKRVFTNMECLDVCLRNTMCDFFEIKHVVALNSTRKWVCAIKRREISMDAELIKSASGWIHFNVSSHELHQVS